jgi:hypothetical protein
MDEKARHPPIANDPKREGTDPNRVKAEIPPRMDKPESWIQFEGMEAVPLRLVDVTVVRS